MSPRADSGFKGREGEEGEERHQGWEQPPSVGPADPRGLGECDRSPEACQQPPAVWFPPGSVGAKKIPSGFRARRRSLQPGPSLQGQRKLLGPI